MRRALALVIATGCGSPRESVPVAQGEAKEAAGSKDSGYETVGAGPRALESAFRRAVVPLDRDDAEPGADKTFEVDSYAAILVMEALVAGESGLTFEPGDDGGLIVRGVRTGGLYERLGLRNGDLLVSLNGIELSADASAMRAVMKDRDRVELVLKHEGQTRILVYKVQAGVAWHDGSTRVAREEEKLRHARELRQAERDQRRRELEQERAEAGNLSPVWTPAREIGSEERSQDPEFARLLDAVQCKSDASCTIERSLVNEIVADPEVLSKQARVVPAIRNGVKVGFKFYGIRPKSLLKRLGVKNGDLLEAVNGYPLENTADRDVIWEDLKKKKRRRFVLEFIRKGAPYTLTIEIRPD